MISVCIALTILVVLATIFLVCMCRCLIKKLKQSKSSNHHHLKVKKTLIAKTRLLIQETAVQVVQAQLELHPPALVQKPIN